MIIPKPLFTGARVALIAPSGPVPEGRLEPAVASVQALGLEPVVFPSCTMRHGYLPDMTANVRQILIMRFRTRASMALSASAEDTVRSA